MTIKRTKEKCPAFFSNERFYQEQSRKLVGFPEKVNQTLHLKSVSKQ